MKKDVMEAAIKCAEIALRNLDQGDVSFEVGVIYKAILAERERAAKIADEYDCGLLEYPSHEALTHYEAGLMDAAEGISKAIRG